MSINNGVTLRTGFLGFAFVWVLLAAFSSAHAAVWYVNAASTAPIPDGKSWATAYSSIQPAADAAASGDEVWVAAGTYTGTGAQVVSLKAGVTLYGGFAGAETERGQRDWTANTTIIDGEFTRRCITAKDVTSAVDGFSVHSGKADYGGGMGAGAAANCTFAGNTARYRGGGMSGGTATNCTFSRNIARDDGGGMNGGTATNCTFSENTAYDGGGGMNGGTATNCTFTWNTATNGGSGGVYYSTAVNCIIWGNGPYEAGKSNVTHSCLGSVLPGTGNITGYPGFVNPMAGDFRVRSGSPCIDTGTTDGVPATDKLGRMRPWGAGVDMGAYEHAPGDDAGAVDPPAVLRVNAASSAAAPDGLTWATAYPTLQAAANLAGYGTEIWVARGTYTDATGDAVVRLRPGTALYGGFAGTESTRETRDSDPATTVIDGGGARRCVMADATTLLDGFTLCGGYADCGSGMLGGMAVNCVFRGNAATWDGGGMYHGTAIGCTFMENKAHNHGGAMNEGMATNCTFTRNTAVNFGGGMFEGTATDCTFTGNKANAGGGKCFDVAVNCVFKENTASYGGGMNEGAATNCAFTQNKAPDGGGINDSTATNCTFTENSAHQGGGMNGSTATNCIFMDNMAFRGGGSYLGSATNCTFTENVSTSQGGGIYQGTAKNCTFTGNMAYRGGGMDGGTAVNCILWGNGPDEACNTAVSHSCLSSVLPGAGNVTGYPGFVNPMGGDFRVRSGSPCIDTGTTDAAPTVDLLDRTRPQGAGVDMGAYEYVPGDDAGAVDPPAVLRVNVACTAVAPDGLTWATAYPTLQAAADLAGYGTEIWVAQGTYSAATGDAVVRLHPGTALYGGFAGTESTRDARSSDPGKTVIEGGGVRRCVTAKISVVLDTFTLCGGNATHGGGIQYGAAVNCIFTGNTADSGGGVFGGSAMNCQFIENKGNYGGGITNGIAINCTFTRNSATYGGGMYGSTIANCTFTGNEASYQGGGMYGGTAKNSIIVYNKVYDITKTQVSYSCLSMPGTGTGNIIADPVFVDAAAGDFRLQPGSPCIDRGTADGAPATDLLGVPRPQGGGIDMGAYEMVKVFVPDLSGLARTAVRDVVAASHLYVRAETEEYSEVIPADHVMDQRPAAGLQVLAGTPVDVVISKGPDVVPVPDLTGLARAAAKEQIAAAQLYAGRETEEYHPTVPLEQVVRHVPAAGAQAPRWSLVDLVISKGPQPVAVPDVVGQMQDAAVASLTGAGLSVGTVTPAHSLTVPAGTVMAQSPAPGTEVLPGAVVDLTVSAGGFVVPELTGKTQDAALTVLVGAQLVVGTVARAYSQTVPAGSVISQSLAPGAPVLPGTPVDLVVSLGTPPSVMPDVLGQPRAQAEGAITAAGLVVGLVTRTYSATVAAGSVISQSPAANTEVSAGTAVSIVVSLGPAMTGGEGEPVDPAAVETQLAGAYDAADSNGDGTLSFAEAAAAVAGLTQSVFDAIDTNGDGQLTPDELGMDAGTGCAGCRGAKSGLSFFDYGKRLSDLFLMALGITGMAAMSALRRP